MTFLKEDSICCDGCCHGIISIAQNLQTKTLKVWQSNQIKNGTVKLAHYTKNVINSSKEIAYVGTPAHPLVPPKMHRDWKTF